MRKLSVVVLFGVFMILSAPSVFAMGKKSGVPGLDYGKIADAVALNPYVMVLQNEFREASKPVSVDAHGHVSITEGIALGQRYDCRVYYAITRTDALVPSEGKSWYEFQMFGDLFLDNLAFFDNARIKTFAPNTILENELWGQSQERNYYEAIRVRANGDLIIEAFTPEKIWFRAILARLGLSGVGDKLHTKLKGMAIPSVIANATGFVLSYSYCPVQPGRASMLDFDLETHLRTE